ncbi:MAG: hypothetical protein M3075_02525 [Candidatus Dormibacteraeota bacterium]|nr:hypothetical protein [Candidatus Dormibacteraeota bacterium]
MRLDPAEVPGLPLPCALLDRDGQALAATPEWAGAGPGSAVFQVGQGHLVVASEVPTPELDTLVGRLLATLEEAAGAVTAVEARRLEVLSAGLALVAGRPPSAELMGDVRRVLELALAAIPARTQGLVVEVVEPLPELAVPAPAAVALAVTQLAVNAHQHERASRVRLRVDRGPSFYVEWPSSAPRTVRVESHRHTSRRGGWGWGYVQMVADALGATALPPGPCGPGAIGACLGLGGVQLTLPLAEMGGGAVRRATLAWDQDPGVPRFGEPVRGALVELLSAAAREPGRIAYRDLYRARAGVHGTWVALPPESGASRARDLIRGLAHERALWSAPEPHATRLHGLVSLLGIALGEPWPSVPPSVWADLAPQAARALRVPLPSSLESLVLPDPRLLAVLLSELEGRLLESGGQVYVQPSPAAARGPFWAALGAEPTGVLHVNP